MAYLERERRQSDSRVHRADKTTINRYTDEATVLAFSVEKEPAQRFTACRPSEIIIQVDAKGKPRLNTA